MFIISDLFEAVIISIPKYSFQQVHYKPLKLHLDVLLLSRKCLLYNYILALCFQTTFATF